MWTWLRKGKLKRESESLLITAENETNNIKAWIDKMQQKRKFGLYVDRNKTINHIISKCSQLSQKEYKTSLRLSGKGNPLGTVLEIKI